MAKVESQSSILDQHDAVLQEAYERRCGDAQSYPAVRAEFERSLEGPGGVWLLFTRLTQLNPASAGSALVSFFNQHLGENGEGCHDTSFLKTVQSQSEKVQNAAIPSIRYDAWQELLNQYLDTVENITDYFENNVPRSGYVSPAIYHEIVMELRRLEIISAEIEKMLHKRFEAEETASGEPGDEIIAAQMEIVHPFHEYVNTAMSAVKTTETHRSSEGIKIEIKSYDNSSPISDPLIYRWRLEKNWVDINNPLFWIREVYVNGTNRRNIGLDVKIKGSIPEIEPLNPPRVRQIIDGIIHIASKYGSKEDPLSIEFSWNDVANILTISTSKLFKIVNDISWGRIQREIEKLKSPWGIEEDASVTPTLHISIPLLDLPNSSSSGSVMPPPVFGDASSSGTSQGGMIGAPIILDDDLENIQHDELQEVFLLAEEAYIDEICIMEGAEFMIMVYEKPLPLPFAWEATSFTQSPLGFF